MKVVFKKTFLRDLERVPKDVKGRVEDLVFRKIPAARDLRDLPSMVKLKGHDQYFRVRLGSFRIGFERRNDTLVFMRVLDRKEIYRRFP